MKFTLIFILICLLAALLILLVGWRVMDDREQDRPQWHEYVACSDQGPESFGRELAGSSDYCWFFKAKLDGAYSRGAGDRK